MATYSWLNGNSADAAEHLLNHSDEPIFLNVDQPGKDKPNWQPASVLILQLRRDEGPQQRVRSYLSRFEPLLVAAGVSIVEKPELTSKPNTNDRTTVAETICARFNEMRLRGDSRETDISLNSTVDGTTLRAHRSFLAAAVPHFTYLLDGWKENLDGIAVDCSGTALELLLGTFEM